DSDPAASDGEAERPVETAGIGRSEQCRGSGCEQFVGNSQLEPGLGPVAGKAALDPVEVIDESQGPEHKLRLVAKVEQKGALAKGTPPNEVMAELYGKLEGCSHGYGGSMHLYDVERGNMGANAVVGGGLPGIVGAALAFKLRGEPRVAVAFFGDGATNIGTFHESLNLAQLWEVPAVFVCENNHWAESTPAVQQLPIRDLAKRAVAYGMHSLTVDGQDVEAG